MYFILVHISYYIHVTVLVLPPESDRSTSLPEPQECPDVVPSSLSSVSSSLSPSPPPFIHVAPSVPIVVDSVSPQTSLAQSVPSVCVSALSTSQFSAPLVASASGASATGIPVSFDQCNDRPVIALGSSKPLKKFTSSM